jgi:predicted RNase H-like nuclease (RuvC/YqgF family)
MNMNQIREAIQRYSSQSNRVERLQQQEIELKQNMLLQQKKKQEFTEHLSQTMMKIQQLASSRQIYQEVDLKDHALATASKEFEEAKERDFRLKLHLESMKHSIPRFLTKVTKSFHPKPTENQVNIIAIIFLLFFIYFFKYI